jgi:predicted dehydrogenase
MKNTIGVCLIGAGRCGMIHARNFASCIPHASLVAISDVSAESAKAAAEELGVPAWYTDYRDALKNPDVDAVLIVTPTKFHHEIALACAKAKKHIYCEKPMAMNVEECAEMIEAAKENNVKIQIGFIRRFDESFRRAKEIVDSGAIGEVVMVKSLTRGPSTPHEWMYDIEKSNGPLAEVNSHDIDTLRWMSGSEAESLYAMAGNYRCDAAKAAYPDFYDSVLMSVRMKNGAMGCIEGAQGVQYGYDARVDILGTKGCVTVGDLKETTTVTYTKENGMVSDVATAWVKVFKGAYVQEDTSFIQCILNDTEPEVTGHDGMMAVAIVRAGNKSVKTGRVIYLDGRGAQKC